MLGEAIGRVPQRWGDGAVRLSTVVHDCGRVNASHAHEAAFVTLMLGGEYSEAAGQRSIRFEKFGAFYHPPSLEHRDSIGNPGVRLLMFEFRSDLLDGAGVNRDVRDLSGTRAAWDLLSLYRGACYDDDALAFDERAHSLVGDLAKTPQRIPRDRPSLDRARDYVHAHFRERLTMPSIARAAVVHPVYLGKLFHAESCETIASYVNRLRVRAAAEALSTTPATLAEIALDHGFSDQSHFTRVFGKVCGITPAAFRRAF